MEKEEKLGNIVIVAKSCLSCNLCCYWDVSPSWALLLTSVFAASAVVLGLTCPWELHPSLIFVFPFLAPGPVVQIFWAFFALTPPSLNPRPLSSPSWLLPEHEGSSGSSPCHKQIEGTKGTVSSPLAIGLLKGSPYGAWPRGNQYGNLSGRTCQCPLEELCSRIIGYLLKIFFQVCHLSIFACCCLCSLHYVMFILYSNMLLSFFGNTLSFCLRVFYWERVIYIC